MPIKRGSELKNLHYIGGAGRCDESAVSGDFGWRLRQQSEVDLSPSVAADGGGAGPAPMRCCDGASLWLVTH